MDTYQIIGLIFTILLTGFFAGTETAFFSANKLSIELKKQQGRHSGRILSEFLEHPVYLIGTCIIGVNIMLVIYGTFVFTSLQPFWEHLLGGELNNPYLKVLVEVLLATFVILLLGEFLPKSLFKAKADLLLGIFAVPFFLFYKILYPIVNLFVSIAEWVLKYFFNARLSDKEQVFNKIELENFMRQSQSNTSESQELNTTLFENALSLVNVKIRECMVPRNEIESIDIHATILEARQKFIETKLSKLIVYDENIDSIMGYIHQLDLFKQPPGIPSVMHPILAVPETMSATDLINKFIKARKSIAWVVDEFGGTAGIVSMEDVLEEIFGEIQDEHDTEEFVEKQISENEYIFSGRLEIDYLNTKYSFEIPENESETLSGFIISHYETIPKLKERIIIDNFEFDILNVTDTRIEMVKMKLLK
jgi:magnesium and cobalt exporter, CNNM family